MNAKFKTAASIILGAGLGIALVCGVAISNTSPDLPPCVTEDSPNCYWDANTRSNGQGESFVNRDGYTYYESGEIVKDRD